MRTLAREATGLTVLLAAALIAGGMALGWSPVPDGAAAQSSTHEVRATHQIRGTVLGPSGEPLEGIIVRAFGEYGDDTWGPWSALPTDTEGSFGIEVPEGTFYLELSLEFEDGGTCDLGNFGSDGRRGLAWEVPQLVVAGGGVEGLDISLSDVPSKLCQRIEGVVVDAEGHPIAGSLVIFAVGKLHLKATDATGTFRLHLREGSYSMMVETDLGSECTVEGYEGAAAGRHASIDVGSGRVDGLRITLSGDASANPTFISCFFPPRMAATTLRPGWNLAGWTAEETDAGALFDVTPALEAVSAWDAGTQSFARATRDDPAGAGDLTTIAPGMGLWLRLSGEEPVTWTRPAVPAGGFVSLQPGWNLVAWAGRDGAAPEDAFAFLREDLLAAAAWEPVAGEFRLYYPGAPAEVNTLRRLELGEALWLKVGVARRWLQPGAAASAVEFVGEVAPETRADIPSRVDDVLAFFGERTGFFVPGVTFAVGEHPVCADYGSGFRTIRLSEACVVAVAHEYAHAVQFTAGGGRTAIWLVEGVAERWSAQYYDHAGTDTYENYVRDRVIRGARFVEAPLEEMESRTGFDAQYNFAHLAVDWLASIAGGDDALFDYFEARTNEEDWQVTFERVFRIGVDDFYTSFAAHRADMAPLNPRLRGVVLEPDGTPLVGATVHARLVSHGSVRTVTTGDDGAFEGVLESGAYDLSLSVDGCLLPWTSSGSPVKAVTAGRSRLEVDEGADTDLVITSSATVAETCRWRWIRGIVTDLAGQPRGGVRIYPHTWVDGSEVGTFNPSVRTTDDGLFAIRVPEGRYGLSVRVGSELGHYERKRGFTPYRPDAAQIIVGATNVGDVAIQFGVIRGVISGPNADQLRRVGLQVGLQEENRTLFIEANPEIEFIAPKGTFFIGVYCPSFRPVGWYGGDSGLVTDRSQAAPIVMDDADVTLTIDIPASVTCE